MKDQNERGNMHMNTLQIQEETGNQSGLYERNATRKPSLDCLNSKQGSGQYQRGLQIKKITIIEDRLSKHANVMSQKRKIPKLIMNWLQEYGEEKRSNKGTKIYFFSKKSKKMIGRDHGPEIVSSLSKYMNNYIVCSDDGVIITVGYRYKNIKDKWGK